VLAEPARSYGVGKTPSCRRFVILPPETRFPTGRAIKHADKSEQSQCYIEDPADPIWPSLLLSDGMVGGATEAPIPGHTVNSDGGKTGMRHMPNLVLRFRILGREIVLSLSVNRY
jgi:hypothetical protein